MNCWVGQIFSWHGLKFLPWYMVVSSKWEFWATLYNHLQHLGNVAANFAGQAQLTLSLSWRKCSIEIEICIANFIHTPLHCLFTTYLNLSLHQRAGNDQITKSILQSNSESVSQWHSSRVQKGYTVCPWVKNCRRQKNYSANDFPWLSSLKSKNANSLNSFCEPIFYIKTIKVYGFSSFS